MEDGKGQRQRWRMKAMSKLMMGKEKAMSKILEERIADIREEWLCGYITDQEFAQKAAIAVEKWIDEWVKEDE